jgi:hypothetical protein
VVPEDLVSLVREVVGGIAADRAFSIE